MHSLLGPSVTDAADSRLGLMSSASHLTLRPGELGARPLLYPGGSRCGRRRATPPALHAPLPVVTASLGAWVPHSCWLCPWVMCGLYLKCRVLALPDGP